MFVTNNPILLLQLSTVRNGDCLPTPYTISTLLHGTATLRAQHLQALQYIHSLLHLSEHNVVSVQPGAGNSGDEELGAVGVRTAVRHREETRTRVLQSEILIGETISVDGLATSTISGSKVSSLSIRNEHCRNLAHELRNNAMEGATLVVELLSRLSDTLLSGAETAEVLSGLGDNIGTELLFIPNTSPTSNTMRPMSFPPALKSMNTIGLSAREANPRNAVAPNLADTEASLVAASMTRKRENDEKRRLFSSPICLLFRNQSRKMKEREMYHILVPGKCLMLGGYLILEDANHGVSLSLSARTSATLCVEEIAGGIGLVEVTSPDLGGKWCYSIDNTGAVQSMRYSFLCVLNIENQRRMPFCFPL